MSVKLRIIKIIKTIKTKRDFIKKNYRNHFQKSDIQKIIKSIRKLFPQVGHNKNHKKSQENYSHNEDIQTIFKVKLSDSNKSKYLLKYAMQELLKNENVVFPISLLKRIYKIFGL